jgi:hypothetical protein
VVDQLSLTVEGEAQFGWALEQGARHADGVGAGGEVNPRGQRGSEGGCRPVHPLRVNVRVPEATRTPV